ncbi:MAG: MAPEG family protein [Pseudomonadota bacterium]
MHIIPLYAAILALFFVLLSIRTIRLRRQLKASLGDAGNQALLRAVRAHSNFAEYAPLSLLLLCFVELSGAPSLFTHALAICLIAGRLSHAYGVSQIEENFRFRVVGMVMTFSVMVGASLFLLALYVTGLLPT